MTTATIHHCPDNLAILDFAETVIVALLGEDVLVEVSDGECGEFSVIVEGETVVSARGSRLPSVEDVVDAVTEAGAAYLAV